jgi:hypothetical protein
MRQNRLVVTAGFALLATVLIVPAEAGPLPMAHALSGAPSLLIATGDREKALAAGAIMGGAVGAILGSTIARQPPPPVVYAPPPPPEAVEEDVVVRRRPARRVVEVEEEEPPPPRVVEEEECLTRRTKVYDPSSGRTIVRRERDCR